MERIRDYVKAGSPPGEWMFVHFITTADCIRDTWANNVRDNTYTIFRIVVLKYGL